MTNVDPTRSLSDGDDCDPVSLLPRVPLNADDALSRAFWKRGCRSYHDAARWVWKLPYGRNSDREDFRLVFGEQRGTCSTQHALLAELAETISLPVELMLGIYMMSDQNTPGIGNVLKSYHLEELPEAHCYLRYGQSRVDLTFPNYAHALPRVYFDERVIRPDKVECYKEFVHRRAIEQWKQRGGILAWSFDELWLIRQRCIAALSKLR